MNDKIFLTIRQTASTGILPEHAIRKMLKQGKVPHVMCGSKAMINYPLLLRQLEVESLKATTGGVCE